MKEVMVKRRKNGIFYISFIGIFLFFLIGFIYPTVCYATSASMTFKVDKKDITKGDKFSVSLYVESDTLVGDFEAYVSYDPEVLEFNPEASFIAGGDGLIKITDNNVVEGNYNRKYVINFTALEAGKSEFKIYDKPAIFDYESGEAMSVSNSPITIDVLATKTASNNTNLSSLKISPSVLEQEFNKDLLEYTATVDWEVTKLIISAIPEDEKAVVLIEGDTNLDVGNNIITIVVNAESKETKKYKITVNRKANEDAVVDDTENEPGKDGNELSNIEINSFSLYKENDDIYIQFGYRYQVLDKEDVVNIPLGYIETTLNIDNINVVAYAPKDNSDSEYLLLYCMNDKGDVGFYQYDRIENTLQRFNKEQINNELNVEDSKKNESNEKKLSDRVMLLLFIVIILGILLIVASVIFAKIYLKTKK
jgi:hypothetical protein